MKILVDLPDLTGLENRLPLGRLLAQAALPFGGYGDSAAALLSFMADRLSYLLEQRGFDVRSVRAVMHGGPATLSPLETLRKLEALAQLTGSESLLGVATLLKRVKNISKGVPASATHRLGADGAGRTRAGVRTRGACDGHSRGGVAR